MNSIIHGDDDDQLNLKPSKGEEDWLSAMQLVTGSVFPMVMKAAIELGLLEIMSKANPSQLSSSQIASQLPTKNYQEEADPLIIDRILRLLASHSILTCSLVTTEDGHLQRLYGLAPLCKYFVPNEDGVSLAPYLLVFQDKVSMDSWHHLKESVLDGGLPFVKAHGMQGFEYAAIDGRMNKLFNEIMYNQTAFVMNKILEIYKGFEGLNQVVDIGGGLGSNLSFIVSKYPHIKAIYFDFPNVIQDSPSCPEGFNIVIRPVIAVDATHLKSKTRGVLLVVVCKDGNEMIYPLAFGFANSECSKSWTWFLKQLHDVILHPELVMIVSDRHMGISNGMRAIFPNAAHVVCAYHLANNLKQHCRKRGDVIYHYYRAAYAYRVEKFDRVMAELKSIHPKVYDELLESRILSSLERGFIYRPFFEIDPELLKILSPKSRSDFMGSWNRGPIQTDLSVYPLQPSDII
ncbi:hypothetical protein LWI29_021294 [Acer saccharum]|uniref:Caffeic acid O-methyltransferase n=1 Tax=Acer saccharum TaxID=4024 RepID=A0AA39T5G3_ACESA|nr:hypothetical protein LWI29_021294 [Acer saccharum]